MNLQSLSIEKATIENIPMIHQLAVEIWLEYYPAFVSVEQINYMLDKMYSSEALKQQMQEGQHFWLLKDGINEIGYCSISEKTTNSYFIHKLYIKLSNHRSGLGSFFMDEVLSNYPSWKEVRLTVNRENYKAINFYFKKEFRIESVADFDIGNNYFMNDFVLVKYNN
jgi:hypothetical protein